MSDATPTSVKPSLNTPVWLHIPCSSIPRARTFYTTIFNWSFFSPPGAPPSLSPFKIPDSTIMGALTSGPSSNEEGKEGGIVVYINVSDVEEILKKVVENGGKVKEGKRVEGGHTEMGSFWDTEGNLVGVLRWLF